MEFHPTNVVFEQRTKDIAGSKSSWIDRDPRWFSTILDFYHMGKHMPMPERQELQPLKLCHPQGL